MIAIPNPESSGGGDELRDAALTYAELGWPVLPCHSIVNGKCSCGNTQCTSPAKHPYLRNGCKGATTDRDTILHWWQRWPQANVAIATGTAAGIVVLDIDPKHGGEESLAQLITEYGDPQQRQRRELIEWIAAQGGRVTARRLQQGQRRFRSAEAAKAALEDLVEAGYGRWEDIPTTSKGGRPSREFQLQQSTVVYGTPSFLGEKGVV